MVKDYPHMIYEVIEAVHLMYEDHPDVEADCMIYLQDALEMAGDSTIVTKWLKDNHRCTCCGGQLEWEHWREPHYELSPPEFEDMACEYCPSCDMK